MFSFWRNTLSTNYFNLVLLLSFLIVFESEAHKMKYCGPKLIRKMFEACETADCNQFGSPDAAMNFGECWILLYTVCSLLSKIDFKPGKFKKSLKYKNPLLPPQ